MKHNILNIALVGCALVSMSSCKDYLDTSSPSTVTQDVVLSSYDNCRSAVDGTYTNFHSVLIGKIFGNGMFYAADVAGSDIERHGGERSATRIPYETFYYGGDTKTLATYNPITEFKEAPDDAYAMLYNIIATTNILINSITDQGLLENDTKGYRQVYGEAICMRATCYRELIKYYGDVPLMLAIDGDPFTLTSRLDIYDKIISDLESITTDAEYTYLPEITAATKNQFTLQYAYALLGRIALERAGYQTFRLDLTSADKLEKHPDYTDNQNATYARATDYKTYYDKAYTAFNWVANNLGAISFDDDYSTFFTQLHQHCKAGAGFCDESLFEDEQEQGASGNDERSYSIGRPSAGGSSNAFPCKSYAQCRINPAFYYGVFDPKDVRRDISCVVTGSDGNGVEKVVPFTIATTSNGAGISCGKFDENRQTTVWTANNRRSGINGPYMRISEVYLGLAEAALMKTTPDQTTADKYYNKTHERAGLGTAAKVTFEEVIDERGFEFAAEGDRRWTLIRTGLIGKKAAEIKTLTEKMMEGLASSKGYYEFDNGNIIPSTIYYKAVDAKALGYKNEEGKGTHLTGATPAAMRVAGYEPKSDLEAAIFPGWRGQHDWEVDGITTDGKKKAKYYGKTSGVLANMAIKGLFTNLETAPAGYDAQPWGSALCDEKGGEGASLRSFYCDELFEGWITEYENGKVQTKFSCPIYLLPFTTNDLIGGLTNGYGFAQGF